MKLTVSRSQNSETYYIQKSREEIMVKFKPSALIPKGEQRSYNGGYLFLQKIYYELGLDYIFKTDFEARPVYVRRDERIKAHFLTCFLALLIYKYLEKKVNRGGKHFTTEEIVDTLREMDFLSIPEEGYIPTYTRTDLTNNLHGSAGFRTDTQIATKQKMRSIIAQTKKREKNDDAE